MAIPKFTEDIAYIEKLGDNPNTDNGLTAQELKEEFCKAPLAIQRYINEVLLPGLEGIQANGFVLGGVAPAGPVLWFDTGPKSNEAVLTLTDEVSVSAIQADVDGVSYGVQNATVNSGPTAKTYDFTVL